MKKQPQGTNGSYAGQTQSGTPCASMPNPKKQAPLNDGSGELGSGATSTGFPVVGGANPGDRGSTSALPDDSVINSVVAPSGVSGAKVTDVSAGRVFPIEPGDLKLGGGM